MCSSFGVTYEGLKQRVFEEVRERKRSFGVTYEGLKHGSRRAGYSAAEGFGVTYEGLKPPLIISFEYRFKQFWSYL